jgi:hypothetical protein
MQINGFKEVISLIKDTLDIAWKVAPVSLLPAGLFLWLYLKSIHWTGIFYDAVMSGSGLIFFVLATLAIAVLSIMLLIWPSILMVGLVTMYDSTKKIPEETLRVFGIALISWLLSFFLLVVWDSTVAWTAPFVPVAVSFVYSLIRLDVLELRAVGKYAAVKSIGKAMCMAAVMALSVVSTAVPMMLCLQVGAEFADISGWREQLILAGCLLSSSLGLFPGFLYLSVRTSHIGGQRPAKFALVSGFMVGNMMLLIALMLPPVPSMILRMTGVYSNDPKTFQILQPNLEGVLAAAGMPVKKEGGMSSVAGYVRFSFGSTRLLCKDRYDAASNTLSQTRVATSRDLPTPGMVAGSHCVPLNSSEIREFKI